MRARHQPTMRWAAVAMMMGVVLMATGPMAQTAEVPAETPPLVQQANAVVGADGVVRGPVTNLPLPRYVSLKANEANVRRGPSLSHRVDWVFTRRDMPLQIVAEYGNWRRVADSDGLGGWVHYAMLSGSRTVIVDRDLLDLLGRADPSAQVQARLEQGVIARLGECTATMCRLSAGGYRGWAPKSALWGVDADELRD